MTTGQVVAIVVLVLLVAVGTALVTAFRRRSTSYRSTTAAAHRQEAHERAADADRLGTRPSAR
jgi:hypothetical protein